MLELELRNRLFSYTFYALAAAVFVASIFTYSIYFIAVTSVLLLFSAIYFHAGHLLNNFLLGHGSVVEIYNGYKLSENIGSAVKRINDSYFSISCALLSGYGDAHKGELISSIVSNVDFPFEFSIGLRSVDKARLLEGLETKRRMKEIEITRSDPKKYDRANSLRRELGVIESEIRGIGGQKPLTLLVSLKCFARGQGELEASRESLRNVEQLAGTFSSALGFEYEIMKGEALIDQLSLEGQWHEI